MKQYFLRHAKTGLYFAGFIEGLRVLWIDEGHLYAIPLTEEEVNVLIKPSMLGDSAYKELISNALTPDELSVELNDISPAGERF